MPTKHVFLVVVRKEIVIPNQGGVKTIESREHLFQFDFEQRSLVKKGGRRYEQHAYQDVRSGYCRDHFQHWGNQNGYIAILNFGAGGVECRLLE